MGASKVGTTQVECVPCPLCGANNPSPWGEERGFHCMRCGACGLLYVNPRPVAEQIDRAVQMGVHEAETLNVVGVRIPSKVVQFKTVLRRQFSDLLGESRPLRWLDVGAGFGELVEAISSLAPPGSVCMGIEPMIPKAEDARRRGISVRTAYMHEIQERFDVLSLIDVFSHVPDFHAFLQECKALLSPGGEIFIKTGNAADLESRDMFPGPLTLPDHLVFGSQRHVTRFLEAAGFKIVSVHADRIDGYVYSLKNLVKKLLGRPVCLSLPYTSPSRDLWIRAKLVA